LERMLSENNPRFLTIDNLKLRVRTSPDLGVNPSKPVVVLFHGASFSLDDWDKIGTLSELSNRAIPYLAVDLPKGKSSKSQKREERELSAYIPLLQELFNKSGIDLEQSKLIIVGPSMGGGFALAYAMARTEQVMGLVLIAPSLAGVNRELLEKLEIPVLLIWGDKDTIFPVEERGKELKAILPKSKLLIVKGARHPVYLDRPSEFHDLLFDFIEEISS
jgi:abhydrolase domain-containing protein 14